mmetsp:Transcript_11512/g.20811  ORF Transcript_11512/g.20811 Transcript_11512/m.20811 type:complete len:261 (-) Transcript_11512:1649-2431(-)
MAPKTVALSDKQNHARIQFYHDLHHFMASIGQPIQRLPTLGFKELDLWVLYNEVISRRGIDAVIAKKQWKEIADALDLPVSCTDSGFRLRLHYVKYLEPYERAHFVPPPEIPSLSASMVTKRSGSLSSLHQAEKVKRIDSSGSRASSPKTFSECATESSVGKASGSKRKAALLEDFNSDSPPSVRRAVNVDRAILDFRVLDSSSLQKYIDTYQVECERSNPTKEELAETVSTHFCGAEVRDETETLLDFIGALRRRENSV